MSTITRGRPPKLHPLDTVALDGLNATSLLQEASERKAVVLRLVELGGRAQVRELNDAFGYDIRAALRGLIGAGWLSHHIASSRKKSPSLPRRPKSRLQ